MYLVAGGVSGHELSSRFDNAEVLGKGDSAWREVTARLLVGPVSSFSGVNLNNKVYLIGIICNLKNVYLKVLSFQVDQHIQRITSTKLMTIS